MVQGDTHEPHLGDGLLSKAPYKQIIIMQPYGSCFQASDTSYPTSSLTSWFYSRKHEQPQHFRILQGWDFRGKAHYLSILEVSVRCRFWGYPPILGNHQRSKDLEGCLPIDTQTNIKCWVYPMKKSPFLGVRSLFSWYLTLWQPSSLPSLPLASLALLGLKWQQIF